MKNLSLLALSAIAISLASCGGEPAVSTETMEPSKKEIVTITTNEWYKLDPENSDVQWNRDLDQGVTTKRIKLFGNWTNVELGPVQLNTSGNVDVTEGVITRENEELKNGLIVFDMAALSFNDQEGGGIFKVRDFPSSRFTLESFAPDSEGPQYNVTGTLQLADSSQQVTFPAIINQQDGKMTMEGNLLIHTLDWPLRDPEARKIVNKDDITISMKLAFAADSSASDTTITFE